MVTADGQGMLLGRQTPVIDSYAPELLYPIARAAGREKIGCGTRHAIYRCRPLARL